MTMMKRVFSFVLVLMMVLGCAVAEEAALGNFPSRGVILALTQEDIDLGLRVAPNMQAAALDDGQVILIPLVTFSYIDSEFEAEVIAKIEEMYATGNFAGREEILQEYRERNYIFGNIILIADENADEIVKEAAGELPVLCENDGYTYLMQIKDVSIHEKDDAAVIEACIARTKEMFSSIQYQPVVIPEEELVQPETVVPNAFPTFTTQDLNGNTVDNSIFANVDLTVVNIWGTTCYPCISEMPELQEWSEEMPENVQIIGLVADVQTGNADTIEMAQMICEATGVNFTNLTISEDLVEFIQGILFTPTTIFVDSNGSIVGDPISGAMVNAYKEFVESYLAQ